MQLAPSCLSERKLMRHDLRFLARLASKAGARIPCQYCTQFDRCPLDRVSDSGRANGSIKAFQQLVFSRQGALPIRFVPPRQSF